MKFCIYLSLFMIVLSCSKNSASKSSLGLKSKNIANGKSTTIEIPLVNKTKIEDTLNYDFALYYVVVADTSLDYYYLQKKMFNLNTKLQIPIDTLGRYYNKTKNRIVLPDNDEDEIYAGDYYPRRDVADYLSLEYMGIYKTKTRNNNIAIVTGIYEEEKKADSALIAIKNIEKKAFKIKANVYVGCLH